MKKVIVLFYLVLAFLVASAAWYYSRFNKKPSTNFYNSASRSVLAKISTKADQARTYARSKKFDSTICFLIDMSQESGKKRFFIVDIQKDSILNTGLVTHGHCESGWLNGRKYGNDVGCGCTSLGKYKVGASYKGQFGLAFKLHGLDSSNSNAFKRYVVLHSHDCVPDNELHPYPLCQSAGCPTVSPTFLKELSAIIKKRNRPVLLWIFE